MKRTIIQVLFAGAAALTVAVGARTAEAGDAAWLMYGYNGWFEECFNEGCANEERRELYVNGDYKEECVAEGCSDGEIRELLCPAGHHSGCNATFTDFDWQQGSRMMMENIGCDMGRKVLSDDAFTSPCN